MPYFEGQELQPQVQLKGIPEKALESQIHCSGSVFNQSPERRLTDLQISPL